MEAHREANRTYAGRYYVLTVLSLLAVQQNIVWMTFGTIPTESFRDFHLTDDEITIIAAYGPIVFIPLTFPFMWFIERIGLKVTVVSSAWILAFAGVIRCFVPISPNGTYWTVLFHIAHMLNGAVGLPVMIAPPRLSSVWFPPKQRTFATAIAAMSQNIGVALAFIIIPFLTQSYGIHTMLYVQAELGLFVALLATIYFPSHPPTPPSVTATTERENFITSLKLLLSNGSFLLIAISGGIVSGGNMGFSSVLSIILNSSIGFSDKVAISSISEFFCSNAWLGATSALVSVIGGQAAGLVADRLNKRFKLLLIILLTIAMMLAFWFAVSVYGYTSNNAVNIFITLCLQYFFAFATTPLFYEAAVEVTYPVAEGSSAGILTILSNIAGLILQVVALCHIFSNEHPERAKVMVWLLGGLTALSVLFLLFYREKYKRFDIDTQGYNAVNTNSTIATNRSSDDNKI